MRQLLTLVLLFTSSLALAQTINPQEPSGVIIAQENAFWTAYVQGNTADLSSLLLPDFTSVEQEIWNRDQVLGFVKMFHANCTLAPVKISIPK